MSQGKYSPRCPYANIKGYEYKYNARKEIPQDVPADSADYNQENDFADYDEDGFDRYGYSAYNRDGDFVGFGGGVDRLGYSEMDYLSMSAEEFDRSYYG
jgi:hypothetical protein